MLSLEYLLLIGSILVLSSIAIAKFSDNLGVPTLLLFIGIGMLAGSEGPGRLYFDNVHLAQSIGVIALIFILFAGGLSTNWTEVRPVIWQATSLSTVGVLVTALSIGILAHYLLKFSLLNGLLLGAIVSSTDAAAVFSVLRSRNVNLRGNLKPLLELESGSNDPMAVFLTIGIIQLITDQSKNFSSITLFFVLQMGFGVILGFFMGKLLILLLNRLKFTYEGIYPVFCLAYILLVYGITTILGGSGFLAVYLTGIVANNSDFVQKKTLLRFFDGLAWLSQITMFLALGLLVFPSRIIPVLGIGLFLSLFLMFVARPLSVFLSLIFTKYRFHEKILVSWVGLRGAVPIILATFPLIAKLPNAELMFNIVFFIVLTSALLQGWSLPLVARLLKVDAPLTTKRKYPIEFEPIQNNDTDLTELLVPYNSEVVGKSIVEVGLPPDCLIVIISRNDNFVVPSGGTLIEEGDAILILANKHNLPQIQSILARQRKINE